jgi:type I restriction enzyme S subunit
MSGWPTVRLEDCAEIVSGATPSTSESAYWDGDVCWATPRDLGELEGAYISDTPRKITRTGLQSCAATVLPPDSVLFSSRAPIGHVAINTVPMATNQGFKSFVPNRERVHAKFLYHWLRRNRPYLESLGNGATFKEVSKTVVARIEIPLPPLPEQRRIADILDKADALRAKRRAALVQLDTLTQSIFLDMFGDPATNPKGIRKQPLGELIKLKSGDFLPTAEMAESGTYPVLGGNGISGFHDQYKFEEPQIVIGRVGAYCGCVHVSPAKSWITDNALYVSERHPDLLFDYLVQALTLAHLNQYASQFGQPLVSGSRIYPVHVLVPPKDAQHEFVARVTRSQELKRTQEMSQNRFDVLFASLQHRAFQGDL